MKYRTIYLVPIIFAVFTMVLVGCVGVSKPSKFYLLNSLPASGDNLPPAGDNGGPAILIGPVTLPAYLDRNQVVTMTGNHELVMNEFTRWAEPLQDNFYRVLTENLSLLLNTPKVYAYKNRGSTPADFQIVIDVTRFDSRLGGDAFLTAFWSVVGKDSSTYLVEKKSNYQATASSTDLAGVVDAQNRTLNEFSREIATTIESLPQ